MEHLGQFSVSTMGETGSVFGQRQQPRHRNHGAIPCGNTVSPPMDWCTAVNVDAISASVVIPDNLPNASACSALKIRSGSVLQIRYPGQTLLVRTSGSQPCLSAHLTNQDEMISSSSRGGTNGHTAPTGYVHARHRHWLGASMSFSREASRRLPQRQFGWPLWRTRGASIQYFRCSPPKSDGSRG